MIGERLALRVTVENAGPLDTGGELDHAARPPITKSDDGEWLSPGGACRGRACGRPPSRRGQALLAELFTRGDIDELDFTQRSALLQTPIHTLTQS